MAEQFPQKSTPAPHLTDRQLEVLKVIATGVTSKEAAKQLGIEKRTVDFHLDIIYGALQVNNRMRAVEAARRHKLLD